jgi:hypothetical protein
MHLTTQAGGPRLRKTPGFDYRLRRSVPVEKIFQKSTFISLAIREHVLLPAYHAYKPPPSLQSSSSTLTVTKSCLLPL